MQKPQPVIRCSARAGRHRLTKNNRAQMAAKHACNFFMVFPPIPLVRCNEFPRVHIPLHKFPQLVQRRAVGIQRLERIP